MGNGNIINDKGDGKDKQKNNNEVNKNDNTNNLQEKIDKGRQELFHPIPQPQNKNKQNLIVSRRQIKKINSAPLEYNNNLVLTDYFDKINDKDKEELERMNYRYKHSFYHLNSYLDPEELSSLRQIKERINSEFGLKEGIKNDFERMKTCLLYCPNLSVDDENFINKLELYDFMNINYNIKGRIINIIDKNKSKIPELINNIK